MANKMFGLLTLGSLSVILLAALSFVTAGQSQMILAGLLSAWALSLTMTAFILWQTETARRAWGYLSLVSGVLSFVLFFTIVFVPVSASAPYGQRADWLGTLDLASSPAIARLREALISAYFAIGFLVAGAVLFSLAYVLLRFSGTPKHHAH